MLEQTGDFGEAANAALTFRASALSTVKYVVLRFTRLQKLMCNASCLSLGKAGRQAHARHGGSNPRTFSLHTPQPRNFANANLDGIRAAAGLNAL